jgi:hypothetical protein
MYVDCTSMHFMTVNATLRLAAYLAVSTSQEAMTLTLSCFAEPHSSFGNSLMRDAPAGTAETNRNTVLGVLQW